MKRPSKNVATFVEVTALSLGLLALWGRSRFGSLKIALLYTGGVRVLADPNVRSIGDLSPQARTSVKFRLLNLSDEAISIHGSKSSCTCLILDDLPRSIPARGRGEFEVAYRAGDVPGEVRQSVVLLTDASAAPRITLTITGRVVDAADRRGVQAE